MHDVLYITLGIIITHKPSLACMHAYTDTELITPAPQGVDIPGF